MPIIEDDPYGLLPEHAPPAFAALAAELAWRIAGLAKCIGAGLRVAYVVVPDKSFRVEFRNIVTRRDGDGVARHRRAGHGWINDGTGDALLAAVRGESAERQLLARSLVDGQTFRTDPAGLHLWLSLPAPWTRSAFAGHMRTTGIGIVASDAFTAGDTPPEAVRVCLDGPADRVQVRDAPEFMAHTLAESPSMATGFL